MNNPDEVIENLPFLTMENSDQFEIVEKYYNQEKMAKQQFKEIIRLMSKSDQNRVEKVFGDKIENVLK